MKVTLRMRSMTLMELRILMELRRLRMNLMELKILRTIMIANYPEHLQTG